MNTKVSKEHKVHVNTVYFWESEAIYLKIKGQCSDNS
jgi:hypothetical protein